jgi:hypothetical protein
MSAKPETTFTSSVHKHTPKSLYRMKNNNSYTGGIPDCWYSGKKADLWVEYKFVPKLPAELTPALTALQAQWLKERFTEGRNVAVIVGSPDGGVILRNLEWNNTISRTEFLRKLKSRAELAAWICQEVGCN